MTPDTLLRSITSHADLLDLTGGDPFVRWGIPDPLTGVVLAGRGAVAVERWGRRGRGLWVFPHSGGDRHAVRELLESLTTPVAELGITGISLPQEYADLLAEAFELGDGGEWDWMWTTQVPPLVRGEDQLVTLDDTADAEELGELSRVHSPTGEGEPGTGVTSLWLGIRSAEGELVAAGAMQALESGAPHLAGIVTHADHRGLGLGRAVTAGLTRHAVAAHGVCTLGMYSANPPARRIYNDLGYQTAYAWHSRRLAGSSSTGRARGT
ncbi:GNAT family N-acetyltransferase [Ornithinimicrobium murale]|uniref:GNAT family N-acetyltransferase n=1 Tax=Ornithinimicrobium murale TaxID=1050153 RepID=UPI000E0CFD3D|nr:GNAT family N-acetyltransferase [Ornithinimicrobium murale]